MISIIIPAYNSAATIVETLESVAAQTFIDYEVLIVDDCSKDETVAVVKKWIASVSPAQTSRFTLHALPVNGGPAMARNRGIQEAKGEWVAFLDADDIWFPEKLEYQMRLAVEQPEVVLWSGECLCFVDGESPEHRIAVKSKTEVLRTVTLEELAWHNPIRTSTVMIRKKVLEDTGGFDTQFRGPEDYDLWLRVAALAERKGAGLVVTDRLLTHYRQTVGSLSMDERKFLPQVLKVMAKAYSSGGVLAQYQHLRNGAMSEQYWGGSWMAFSRGDRIAAIQLWLKAWRLNCRASLPAKRPWYKMLIRYCCLPQPNLGGGAK